jgi:hypothetical protein
MRQQLQTTTPKSQLQRPKRKNLQRRTRPGGSYERWVKFFSTDDNGNNFLRRLVNFEKVFEFFFIFFTYDV